MHGKLTFFSRFFGFGGQTKKKTTPISGPMTGSLQQQHTVTSGGRRRGSDRSLSGSAHELAICGVRDVTSTPRVPHSHSQSNLTDIPYRFVKSLSLDKSLKIFAGSYNFFKIRTLFLLTQNTEK